MEFLTSKRISRDITSRTRGSVRLTGRTVITLRVIRTSGSMSVVALEGPKSLKACALEDELQQS